MSRQRDARPAECRAARERMLEADPSTLGGHGESELARHLRRCDACRQAGAAILAAHRALADVLERAASRVGLERAVALAERGRAVGGAEDEASTPARGARRRIGGLPGGQGARRRWPRRLLPLVPLAAAAALAILLIGRGAGPRPGTPGTSSGAHAPAGGAAVLAERPRTAGEDGGFALRVPEGGHAIVFATRDPRITVVWLH